jgi:2-phosphosulfolactate phosphatase
LTSAGSTTRTSLPLCARYASKGDHPGHARSDQLRVDVAFTPSEAARAPLGIVVDVLRATSTIAQALAAGYRRVLCCAEIDEARALRAELGEGLLGGERTAVRVPGFDVGASPREFLEPRAETLILSTTNGTRAIVTAATSCEEVVLGSLLNLDAVAAAARERNDDVAIVCAGFAGALALDDAYCAGRIVQLLDGDRSDAALAAELVARSFPDASAGLNARTYGPPGLEDDIAWCARESVLDVVPRLARMVGSAGEVTA